METEKEIDDLTKQINAARAKRHEGIDALSGSGLRELEQEITSKQRQRAELIAEGCGPCLKCKSPPIGRVQQFALGRDAYDGYGIMCSRPACRVRADHLSHAKLVAIWNTAPRGMDEPDSEGPQLKVG